MTEDARETTAVEIGAAWPRRLVDVPLVTLARVDSTQRMARAYLEKLLAEGEAPSPFVVAAIEQSAGRGRRGRAWQSAPGLGVWATLVVSVGADILPSIPMRAGVALAEVIGAVAPGVGLKWPNDLVHSGRKLGGLLVDVVTREQRPRALVGFGINCFHLEADLPEPSATSLQLAAGAAPPPLCELLPSFVSTLLARFASGGDWLERYRALSAHATGDDMVCDLDGERIAGRFAGFDEHGFLRIRTGTQERVLTSGDVFSW